jgi:acyl-CoA synthetase (AMP-forming)/AMP-acid ligase II
MSKARPSQRDAGAPWSGVSAETVIDLIARACRREPEKPALILEEGLVVTRLQFLERAERLAGALAGCTKPGDHVALMLDTRAECPIVFAAALAARCVLVPIDPAAKAHDAGHILRDSGSVLVLAAEKNAALLEDLRPQCPALRQVAIASSAEPDGFAAWGAAAAPPRRAAGTAERDEVAAIYYTSGTTGAPKGCILDHAWWLRACDIHVRLSDPEGFQRPLCCMPFHHVDSMMQFLCALHAGGTLVVMRRFSVSRFWRVVRDHQVTQLYLIASMPVLLLKATLSPLERDHDLREAICLAVPAHLHRALVDRFGIPFLDAYGTTEAGWSTRVPADRAEAMVGSGSIGSAVPEAELRVVDDADRDVPPGRPGELITRAPGLFAGYLNQPMVTAEILRDGWYYSGDIVRADEQGFYYFLGRKKDMIRRSGENIAAAEVEDVLRTHPMILDAAVVAVPDEIREQEVKAYVLLAEGRTVDDLSPDRIVAYCADRLAAFKVPRYIAYRKTDFPRTPTMRVRKEELGAASSPADSWDRLRGGWIDPPPAG